MGKQGGEGEGNGRGGRGLVSMGWGRGEGGRIVRKQGVVGKGKDREEEEGKEVK